MNFIRLLVLVAVAGTWSVASHHAVAQDVVTMPAVQKRVVVTVSAAARMQTTSNTVLSAPTAGIVSGLRVLPGEMVRPGQTIAHLTGPMVSTENARLEADLKSAQIRVSAATQAAVIEQQKFDEQLSTRDAIARAHAELDTARQQLVAAQTAARSYTSLATIGGLRFGNVLHRTRLRWRDSDCAEARRECEQSRQSRTAGSGRIEAACRADRDWDADPGAGG